MVKILVLGGPTGTGKSSLAVEAAKLLDGEIVNADSVQVYRHFDIGSAKPSAEMRREIPHHLIDVADPDERFSLWEYGEAARKAVEDIAGRGKVPILAGGTGLYIKAVLENMDGGAAPDPALRAELESAIGRDGLSGLYERLKREAPESAAKIHPNDRYRIIRGMENAMSSSRSAGKKTGASSGEGTRPYDCDFFVLSGPRALLHERINARVDARLGSGWVDEAKKIVSLGYNCSYKPFRSVGYGLIADFIEGRIAEEALADEIKKETRHYAKRQITWFNGVRGAIWINTLSPGPEGFAVIAEYVAGHYRERR